VTDSDSGTVSSSFDSAPAAAALTGRGFDAGGRGFRNSGRLSPSHWHFYRDCHGFKLGHCHTRLLPVPGPLAGQPPQCLAGFPGRVLVTSHEGPSRTGVTSESDSADSDWH
jgi:hypothetical protein